MTERPIALGDVVRERARIGGRMYEGDWTVAEHVPPTHVVLQAGSGRLQISYAFRVAGTATEFERTLEYQPEDFAQAGADPAAVEALMFGQSEQGLQKLKRLVEELLHRD